MDPHQWNLQKLNLKSYHLHHGMQLFRKSANRSWLKEIKHFLQSLERNLAQIQIRMMFELLTDHISRRTSKLSQKLLKIYLGLLLRNLNLPLSKKGHSEL